MTSATMDDSALIASRFAKSKHEEFVLSLDSVRVFEFGACVCVVLFVLCVFCSPRSYAR
jgi:hypothetical protein